MPERMKLTEERVRRIAPPEKGKKVVWDTDIKGFGVQVLASGIKSYVLVYRAGHGRAGTPRYVTIGKVGSLKLEAARDAALNIRGQVALGRDPVAEWRAEKARQRREAVTLSKTLASYETDQERRNVSDRKNVQSALRRHLMGHLGDIPVVRLDRRAVVEAIEALEAKGLNGAARSLRGHASTFLKWCADRELIDGNPLAGYRKPRSTRAERLAQPGRTLSDDEIRRLWTGCGAENVNPIFGAFVRFLLLTGQRRSETALMQWNEVTDDGWWTIPAERAKNGHRHEVPLPELAQEILAKLPRYQDCPWAFTTNGKAPMSGWSKLMAKLRDAAKLDGPWTLHDLRRTFRSGLTRLRVDPDIAEIMLNHRPETLRATYDREPRLKERQKAAERWAKHLAGVVAPRKENVIVLKEQAS